MYTHIAIAMCIGNWDSCITSYIFTSSYNNHLWAIFTILLCAWIMVISIVLAETFLYDIKLLYGISWHFIHNFTAFTSSGLPSWPGEFQAVCCRLGDRVFHQMAYLKWDALLGLFQISSQGWFKERIDYSVKHHC